MKKLIEEQIRKAYLYKDENDTSLSFDEEKVWRKVKNSHRSIKWKLPMMAAAIFFMLLSGGLAYMLFSSHQRIRNYEQQLSFLDKEALNNSKVLVDEKTQPIVITKLEKVIETPVEIVLKMQHMEDELAYLKENREKLKRELAISMEEIDLLRDTMNVLKAKECTPLFTQKVRDKTKKGRYKTLKININEKALAELPLEQRTNKKKESVVKVKVIDRNGEIAQTSAPLFSSISLD